MSDVAIQVESIGKRYRIGREKRTNNFREAIMRTVTSPLRRLRNPLTPEGDDSFWALKDVSFNVDRGEVVGVIGRNGAGKSTLLKILSRITEPTEGQAIINGRVGSLLEVGTGFHPELTGRENVYLNGAILGMKRGEIDRKFDEIVAFGEIEKFLDTPVKHYSSGMYMRLAFAVAAHLDPEILMVDEVLAVGDAEFQKKCLGKMSEVSQAGRTVLFVSHNMTAIESLCDRVLLLEHGKTKAISDDIRPIITQYLFHDDGDDESTEWINTREEYKNPWFFPQSFRIVDSNDRRPAVPVRNDADLWVRIEGLIEQLDPGLSVGYTLFSEEGHALFWSRFTDTTEETWPRIQRGTCVLRSQFPKRLLNEGTYRLELNASLHGRQWLCQPASNAPAITIQIQGGLSDSPVHGRKLPCLLAPVFPWYSET